MTRSSITSLQSLPVKRESDGTMELLILSYVVLRIASFRNMGEAGYPRTTHAKQRFSYVHVYLMRKTCQGSSLTHSTSETSLAT